jgi:DNA-binding GntR family transcriptional regulator
MATSLKLVKTETLREQVENHLREAIVSGQLKAGEKLIVNVPHRGPVVASITLEEARDLYALRRLLESYAAHEFTRLATDAEIKQLADAVKQLRRAGAKNSRKGVLSAKASFYGILMAGCRNALVSEILGGLLSRVSLLRSTSLMLPDRLPKSLQEIEALLACIQRRDAVGAQEISTRHVLNAEAAALGVFEQELAAASKAD